MCVYIISELQNSFTYWTCLYMKSSWGRLIDVRLINDAVSVGKVD